jgi:rod shape determining protein RodA
MAGVSDINGPLIESRGAPARKLDWWLILSSAALLLVGVLSLYSIDAANPGTGHLPRQLLRLFVGIGPFALFLLLTPRILQRYWLAIYLVNLGMLVLVLAVGRSAGGAQRWLSLGPIDFQPSEMAKLLTVITLAAYFAGAQDRVKSLATFVVSFLHVSVPLLLIFKQPHLGASLVLLVAWLAVSLAAGVPWRFLVGAAALSTALLIAALSIPGVFRSYQLERVMAMFGGDAQGSKYQQLRSQIAFGVGGLTGTGFLQGEQKRSGFVPEQHTDFIFTVIGEEGGLVGCSLVLLAFAVFFYRIWLIAFRATDPFFRMVASGVFAVLAFHTIVNLGMNLELLPVVGLWLPFMSYGGTAIWLCLSALGLLLNIRARERPVLF